MFEKAEFVELLDDMSDGQWHPMSKIAKRNNKFFSADKSLTSTIEQLVADGTFITGANNSFRMKRDAVVQWREYRGLPMKATTKNMNAPRFFGGILEDDGWTLAPLRKIDVVHCHANDDSAELIKNKVGYHGITLYNFEGLVRVFTLNGQYVNSIIKQLKDENPYLVISGIRTDKDSRRRELCDLPQDFVQEMCEFYGVFAHALLRQSMSSVKKHILERDDIQQQIYMWIIDAIQRYDHTTAIPFAAYLHSAMNRWVHDLSRKSFGRAVADSELQIARARSSFALEHNRQPTVDELAHLLGGNVQKTKKKILDVSSVASIRDTSSLYREDNSELPVIANEKADTNIHNEVENAILSAALVSSAKNMPSGPDIVSWCNIYARTWGEGTSDKVSASEKEVMHAMSLVISDSY